MKKLFISQPMRDKTNEEIETARENAVKYVEETLGEKVEVLDSFFKDAPHDAAPLWFLGKSLEILSTADCVVFLDNWLDYRGCRIEYRCCTEYGIPILKEN